MQSYPIKKNFFQHTTATTLHRTKANEQLQILSATTYCELAVHLLFFEKTSVLRLHCGNPFAPIQSLYAAVLYEKPVSAGAAGSFCKVTSDRALNRPRSPEVRKPLACFLVLFARRKKNKLVPFVGNFRGFPNLESAYHSRSFAPQQLKPFSGSFSKNQKVHTNPLKISG